MKIRKVAAGILTAVLLMGCSFGCFVLTTHGASNDPVIRVSDVTANPGETVAVDIALQNNPGIVSMTLRVTYDASFLTLTKVEDAGVLGETAHNPKLKSPYTLVWVNDLAAKDFTAEGKIVTLYFAVSENAAVQDVADVRVNYNYNRYDIYNQQAAKVRFLVENGAVTVGLPGDMDGDGSVNDEDVLALLWYTLFPTVYEITGDGDFDGNGSVDDEDVLILLWHTLFPEFYPL